MKFIDSNSVSPTTSDSFEFLTSILRDTNCSYKQTSSSVLNSDPMLNSCNDFKYNNKNSNNFNINEDSGNLFDISNTNSWMNKPIKKWMPEDVLFWISYEANKYGMDIFKSYLPSFCLLNGNELINLTVDDFISKIPSNYKFAVELHKKLQHIKQIENCCKNHTVQTKNNCDSDVGLLTILKSFSISNNKRNKNNKSNNNDEYNFMNIGYEDISNVQSYTDNYLSMDFQQAEGDSGVDSCSDSEQGYGGDNNSNSFENLENMDLFKSDDKSNNCWTEWDNIATNCLKNNNITSSSSLGIAKRENDNGISVSSLEDEIKSDEELPLAPVTKKRPGRPRGIRKKKPGIVFIIIINLFV